MGERERRQVCARRGAVHGGGRAHMQALPKENFSVGAEGVAREGRRWRPG